MKESGLFWGSHGKAESGRILEASFVTKLPKHDLAKAAAFSLQKYGVDIS